MPATASTTSLSSNLQRLVLLRTCLVVGELTAIAIAVITLRMTLPVIPLLVVEALYMCANLVTWWQHRKQRLPISQTAFVLQVAGDVVALACFLYFVGGSTYPFVWLFLLPVIIAGTTLPKRYAWAMAAFALGCYTLLMFVYIPLPHVAIRRIGDFDLHVFGMWAGFLFSLLLILGFVLKMAENLRRNDRILADMREKALRDEQIVALGTFAAGAAHELGTPLATISLLADDLADHATEPGVVEQTVLLKQQTRRCKDTLTQLATRVGALRAESGRVLQADHYLEDLLANWRVDYPHTLIHNCFDGDGAPPRIVADDTIGQAIVNVLNNAIEASPNEVEFVGHWTDSELAIEVRDRGPGPSTAAAALAGRSVYSEKEGGHGLGLFLTRSVLNRFGGTLQLLRRENGGTCARLTLPLQKLSIPEPC